MNFNISPILEKFVFLENDFTVKVVETVSFDNDIVVSVFETNIRVVG